MARNKSCEECVKDVSDYLIILILICESTKIRITNTNRNLNY